MAEVNAKKDDVLYYSPSVTVVVAVRSWKNGVATWRYLDISDDVASCNVKLNINDESTFSVTVQNAGGKYTDFFHDGDRIQISCTKTGGADEPYTLLTGHIHAADSFQLYGDAVKISGGCPIHMLKKHYYNFLFGNIFYYKATGGKNQEGKNKINLLFLISRYIENNRKNSINKK